MKYYASNTERQVFCIANRFSIVLKYFIYHFLLERSVYRTDASRAAHSALPNKIINQTSSYFIWVLRPVKTISLIFSRDSRKVGRKREIPEKSRAQ